jgi:hypothetical protein
LKQSSKNLNNVFICGDQPSPKKVEEVTTWSVPK